MLSYPIMELKEALGAVVAGPTDRAVTEVSIDSRRVGAGGSALFFAIEGERHDGHTYIAELYRDKGLRVFVINALRGEEVARLAPEATLLLVDSPLLALQRLARHHRERHRYPVIGITGSNGKTIVKEWLAQLLSPDRRVVRSPKSFNSQVGVPLSVLGMSSEFDLCILEAGISLPGEMSRLEPMVQPDIGIFTNIGPAHGENFPSLQDKAVEKLRLFERAQTLIYRHDDPTIAGLAHGLSRSHGVRLMGWGRGGESAVSLVDTQPLPGGTAIAARHGEHRIDFTIPFTDAASLENAMHCLCVLLLLGIPIPTIAGRMGQLAPVAMRLELKEGINGCTVINDSYNSDLGSLAIALDQLMQQRQHRHHLLILSDILQSGIPPASLYQQVAKLVEDKRVSGMVGIGPALGGHAHLFGTPGQFYPDTDTYLRQLDRGTLRDSAILIKGSRPFQFERISSALEQKTHRTVLEIDLNALVHNLNYFRGLLAPGVRVMAMVKAFSYGSGSHEIANLLQYHRVDYLGVAFADEGVALRQAGITLPIVVLNPAYGSHELMIRHGLEPEVFNLGSLESFHSTLVRLGVAGYPIHIELDTGMRRLGFGLDQVDALCRRLAQCGSLRVSSILSHLVGSEDPQLDAFSRQQIDQFEAASRRIEATLGYRPMRHMLNSAGIERFPGAQFDMVRLGIGLYGVSATLGAHLRPISTLKTYVAQLHHLPPGESVGYNRKGLVHRPSAIATLPVGYADGLSRRLSNGVGQVLIHGQLAPIIGNVCMDLCMVDVTGIPVNEGDEVTLFGAQPTISDLAQAMGTIPYEVLTSISRRVKRVYIQE